VSLFCLGKIKGTENTDEWNKQLVNLSTC